MRFIFGIITIYCLAYLLFFWQTPLGMEAVLDGAENILLSEQIFHNSLPAEPFYRSMLYQHILAGFWFLGLESSEITLFASLLGIVLHIFNAFLCGKIAFKLWNNSAAFCAAMLLYGLYPPLIFFAAEPIDATLAITFMQTFGYFLVRAHQGERDSNLIYSGIALGLGILTRSNLLPLAGLYLFTIKFKNLKRLLKGLAACLLVILAGQSLSYYHSGKFTFLPWQNSYNLYASNKPTSNGKYYRNTLLLSDRPLGTNPARLESEILYNQETGKAPLDDLKQFNDFWFKKFLQNVKQNPENWLKLLARKLYYTFNNFEQYNNKTFSFHKALSPILRYNPLSFGFLFAALTLVVCFRPRLCNSEQRRILRQFLAGIVLLSAGTVLYYASAKFRLLMVPLIIPIASGIFALSPKAYLRLLTKPQQLLLPVIVVAMAAAISFSTLFAAADTSTYKEDKMLMAQAASRIAMYPEQVYWASQALLDDPENPIATRVRLVGITNLLLSGQIHSLSGEMSIHNDLESLSTRRLAYPDTNLIALYHSLACAPHPLKFANHLASFDPNNYWHLVHLLIKRILTLTLELDS
jgi:4-amino-4-deoxy-L-arabinose transferase-like glycosyltransferase